MSYYINEIKGIQTVHLNLELHKKQMSDEHVWHEDSLTLFVVIRAIIFSIIEHFRIEGKRFERKRFAYCNKMLKKI